MLKSCLKCLRNCDLIRCFSKSCDNDKYNPNKIWWRVNNMERSYANEEARKAIIYFHKQVNLINRSITSLASLVNSVIFWQAKQLWTILYKWN